MRDSLYLAWHYVCHHRFTTLSLICSITLIAYLPAALEVIVNNAEEHFRARASSTPLLVGAKGSQLELVLSCLYFDGVYDDTLSMKYFQQIEEQKLGLSIPIHAKFKTDEFTVVGTTSDYAIHQNLQLAQGSHANMMGECVVGSHVAKELKLHIGSKLPVSSSPAFLLTSPKLRLKVVGILFQTETPDDNAILVDLKTTWIMEGLGHGHVKSAPHGSANAANYTDITKENVNSFHFHGDESDFPITSILVVPSSQKNETLLLGQYFSADQPAQIVRPQEVMDSLLEKVFMVRSYIVAIIAVVSMVTLLTISLVIVLSIRLRQAELSMMKKIGCSRFTIAMNLGCQILIILSASVVGVVCLTLVTDLYGRELIRLLIL
ncbi:MAG: hypothetical protein COA78_03880 [Blastopirellula sp.]|nr:MAG: hypothetical protein COA78_03880 [Blastopirellula sp.]